MIYSLSSFRGAERLRRIIADYWLGQGYAPPLFHTERGDDCGGMRGDLRSDMINGLPRVRISRSQAA